MGKDTLDFDSREFFHRLDIYDEKSRAAGTLALIENSLDLEKNAKATAPKLDAELERDIKSSKRVKERRGGLETEVHGGTGHSRNYAVRMHESLLPAVPVGDIQFKPGPVTAGRPPQPWGPAGGKYLTRPLLYKMKEYTKHIADVMKRIK